MPPCYCQERYGVEDNRFDLRQLFYDTDWTVPFAEIDALLEKLESRRETSVRAEISSSSRGGQRS
jgi:hypothetical protein